MINKFLDIIKFSAIYGFTSSLQTILGFLLLPLLTKYFTTEIFGVYSLILVSTYLCTMIFSFGATSSLGRYYYEFEGNDKRKEIVGTTIFIISIGLLSLITIFIFFGNLITDSVFCNGSYSKAVLISMISGSLQSINSLLFLTLRYNRRAYSFLSTGITGFFANFLLTYIFIVKYNMGLISPFLGSLLANTLQIILLVALNYKYILLSVNLKYTKMLLQFGVVQSLVGLLFFLMDTIDRFMINYILSTDSVGIYSVSYKIGSTIQVLLIMPLSLAWAPFRMENRNAEWLPNMTNSVLKFYTIIGSIISLSLCLFSNDIYSFLISNSSYEVSSNTLLYIMAGVLFFGAQNIVDFGIYLEKKLKYYLLTAVISLSVNVVLNLILLPKLDYLGAALATLITYLISTSTLYFLSQKYYKFQIEYIRIILTIIALFTFVYLDIFMIDGMGHLGYKIILMALFMIFIFFFAVNSDERKLFYLKLLVWK